MRRPLSSAVARPVLLPPRPAEAVRFASTMDARRAVRLGYLSRPPRVQPINLRLADGNATTIPTLSLLVHQSLVSKLTAVAVPFIEHIATTTEIPAQDAAHYSFPAFNLSAFSLGAVDAQFEAPDEIVATFDDVNLTVPTVPFYVYEKIFGHKFGCHGTFSATVQNSQLMATLALERSPLNGSLIVTHVAVQANFGTLHIQHSFDSDICKIAGDVLGFFFGGLNNLLRDLVQDELPAKLANIIRNETNSKSGKTPLRLAAAPNVTDNSLELVASLAPTNQTPATVPQPNFDQFPPRDIAFYLTEQSVNTLLAMHAADFVANLTIPPGDFNTTSLRSLIPAAYTACPGCAVGLALALEGAAYVTMANSTVTAAVMQLQLTVTASNATLPQPVELMVLSVDLQLQVSNLTVVGANLNTIYFQLQLPQLSATVVRSDVGTLGIPVIVWLAHHLLDDILLAAFNRHFDGVALPNSDGFSTGNVIIQVDDGQLAAAADVNVPPTAAKSESL